MLRENTENWLLSHRSFSKVAKSNLDKKARIISVASGKGGVGKTSIALKFALTLAQKGYKTLLIDCDYNLSNSYIKLNISNKRNLYSYYKEEISLDECIIKKDNFNLLAGCNGNLELFKDKFGSECFFINVLASLEKDYDYIFLDSPAGIGSDILALNAYSDDRIIVVTPDKSSLTDSYSLIKILNKKYGVNRNFILANMVLNKRQYKRIVTGLSNTVDMYLTCRLSFLGKIDYSIDEIEHFDQSLFCDKEEFSLHQNFCKVIDRFTESYDIGPDIKLKNKSFFGEKVDRNEQDVRTI